MGLIKQGGTTVPPVAAVNTVAEQEAPKAESGTVAAVKRLQEAKGPTQSGSASPTGYKPRDFDKEARDKTRCVQFEAALKSPAIAGMAFKNMKEYLALCREAADEGVRYSFEE